MLELSRHTLHVRAPAGLPTSLPHALCWPFPLPSSSVWLQTPSSAQLKLCPSPGVQGSWRHCLYVSDILRRLNVISPNMTVATGVQESSLIALGQQISRVERPEVVLEGEAQAPSLGWPRASVFAFINEDEKIHCHYWENGMSHSTRGAHPGTCPLKNVSAKLLVW